MSTEEDQVDQEAVQANAADEAIVAHMAIQQLMQETVAAAVAPVAAPEAPKPLGERIADAASSFGDAVRHMTMADDSKLEKVVTLQKAQDAVNNADGIVSASRTDGLGAADALVAVVNEWKVAVASRG